MRREKERQGFPHLSLCRDNSHCSNTAEWHKEGLPAEQNTDAQPVQHSLPCVLKQKRKWVTQNINKMHRPAHMGKKGDGNTFQQTQPYKQILKHSHITYQNVSGKGFGEVQKQLTDAEFMPNLTSLAPWFP